MDSMVYFIENGELSPYPFERLSFDTDKPVAGAVTESEWETLTNRLDRFGRVDLKSAGNSLSKIESYEGFDFITLTVPEDAGPGAPAGRIHIYFGLNLLLFICPDEKTRLCAESLLKSSDFKCLTNSKLLFTFFDRLTENGVSILDELEQQITDLEESLISTAKSACAKEIVSLRRRLLSLKRYYEQLFIIAQSMEDNENGLIGNRDLRYFRMLTNRIDRLLRGVINLRDYVTQVREAYQAEVDIELNGVMKFFTVLTAFFLPPTLIVGWYGMNFAIPEYKWPFGYAFVIGLCVLVTLFFILYFKKKKWF